MIKFFLIYIFFATLVFASPDWSLAEKNIKKLFPSDFLDIPQHIKQKLEEKGCKIPQAYVSDKPHNIIKGSFAGKNTKDWAALCSIKEKSYIYVIWENKQPCPTEIAHQFDKNFL